MDEVKDMSFESALAELEKIIDRLEAGDVELEESISLYERGAKLRQHCDVTLKAAKEKIEKVVQGSDGQPQVESTSFD